MRSHCALRRINLDIVPENINEFFSRDVGICNGCPRTWLILSVARVSLRLVTVFHVPDVLHGTTMVRAETVQGAGVRFRVVRPWILVMNTVFIKAVGVIVTGLAEGG